MIVGNMQIASEMKQLYTGLKEGAKGLWARLFGKSEDAVKCVGFDIDDYWTEKLSEDGKTYQEKATDRVNRRSLYARKGVRGCDKLHWSKPHETLQWGVVDEVVFVNQPVEDQGKLVPTMPAGVRMYGGTICGTTTLTTKTDQTRCFQYVGAVCVRAHVYVGGCTCVCVRARGGLRHVH